MTGTETVRNTIADLFGIEESGALFALLQEKSRGSLSLLQSYSRGLFEARQMLAGGADSAGGTDGRSNKKAVKTAVKTADFFIEKLRYFFSSPLFRTFFLEDATYVEILPLIIRNYLLIAASYPAPVRYPNFPMKTVYEKSRVNLHKLNSRFDRQMKELGYGGEASRPEVLFLQSVQLGIETFSASKLVTSFMELFMERAVRSGEEARYFFLLLKMLILFSLHRGLSFHIGVSSVKKTIRAKNITSKELLFLLYDFYIDDRYSGKHLLSLFSLIGTCVTAFYPDRRELIPSILNLLKDFIRISHSETSRYLKRIFELFVEHPHLDLSDWVVEGARIIREHGDSSKSAKAYFERESDLSRRIWQEVDSGIYFEQVFRRLQFFVNAIVEEPVGLKKVEDFPLSNRDVEYYTDGKTIFMPGYVNFVKDREKNYMMLLHSVAHECAHIEFGSFTQTRDRYISASKELNKLFPGEFVRNKRALTDYLGEVKQELTRQGYTVGSISLDPHYASYLTRLLFHAEFPFLLNDLWNILEDYRVNRRLYGTYKGYAREREIVDAIDFDRLDSLDKLRGVDNLLNGFIQSVWFRKLKGSLGAEEDSYHKLMMERFDEFKGIAEADVYDSIISAGRLYKIVIHYMNRNMPEMLRQARVNKKTFRLDLSLIGVTGDKRNSPLQAEIESMKSKIVENSRERGEDIEKNLEQRKAKKQLVESSLKHMDRYEQKTVETAGELYLYPEWDVEKYCYLTDHCILAELPSSQPESGPSNNLRGRYAHYVETVKRTFMKLRPENLIERRGMDDGHEIDFDRYVDALMDFSSGNQMENNFYVFRERRHRSVLSALVLDMSPSTESTVWSGETIFLHEKYATYLLSEAMNAIGDPFGIFSFYDYGPSATLFHTLKSFTEPYTGEHYNRLAAFQPAERGFSRLSVGLRHLIAKMQDHDAKSKIIFFITDGFPCYFEGTVDKGETSTVFYIDGTRRVEVDRPVPVVEASYKSNSYIRQDLRKVYEEAVMADINLFCITLDKDSVHFMEEVFGNALIYLPDITELPKRLLEIFRKVTT